MGAGPLWTPSTPKIHLESLFLFPPRSQCSKVDKGGQREGPEDPGVHTPAWPESRCRAGAVPTCVPLVMTALVQARELRILLHTRSLSEVVSGVSAEVSTPELFKPLPQSLGSGSAALGEAEAWHLWATPA